MPIHDVAIIGAGPTGLALAEQLTGRGRRVVIFDRNGPGGMTELGERVPRHALARFAAAAAAGRTPVIPGIVPQGVVCDWTMLKGQILAASDNARRQAEARLVNLEGLEVVRAAAHFVSGDHIEAGGRRYRFRRAIVATGSGTIIPDYPGLVSCNWRADSDAWLFDRLPEHLIILGGEADGVAGAQAFARLGARVTVVTAEPNIVPFHEPEHRALLRSILQQDGVEILENTPVVRIGRQQTTVWLELAGGARLSGTELIITSGRSPRLSGLDLPAAGIVPGASGIRVDHEGRSPENGRIWAAGEAAAAMDMALRPTPHAISQSVLRSRTPLLSWLHPAGQRHRVRTIDSMPGILQLGLTEAEAVAMGMSVTVTRRARDPASFLSGLDPFDFKLVRRHDGKLLGASLFRPDAGRDAGWLNALLSRGWSQQPAKDQPSVDEIDDALNLQGQMAHPDQHGKAQGRIMGWMR